jgi:hypothetical protein
MSNQPPMTTWQQCRAISEALISETPIPAPEDPELVRQKMRAAFLEQIAAGSEKGAKFAARFANTDGPIQVEAGDVPEELMRLFSLAD